MAQIGFVRRNRFRDPRRSGIADCDAVGNIQVQRFPLILHQPVEISGQAFLQQFRRERGVERQKYPQLENALEVLGTFIGGEDFVGRQFEALPIDLHGVWPTLRYTFWIGLTQSQRNRLQIFSGARAQLLGVGFKAQFHQRGLIVDQNEPLDIRFLQNLRCILGVLQYPSVSSISGPHVQSAQRRADLRLTLRPQTQGEVLDADDGIDASLQLFVNQRSVYLRITRQVDGTRSRRIYRANQILINLFRQKGQRRRHHASDGCEHRVDRLIRIDLVRPETPTRAAKIPVGKLVIEKLKGLNQPVML